MSSHTDPRWSTCALLTIDMQRDFLSDGACAVPGTTEVLPALLDLAAAFRQAQLPIVHVVRLYLADGSNADLPRRGAIADGAVIARPGTPGAELAGHLIPSGTTLDTERLLRGKPQTIGPAEYVVFKPRWNAFFDTCLDLLLRSLDVDTVVIAGCNFPNCPRGTLFGASERDYRAVAVPDAISRWTDAAAAELAGIGVRSLKTADIVAAVERK